MIECFKKIFSKVLFVVLCSVTSMSICAQESLSLSNGKINILWEKHEGKWVMTLFEGKTPEGYKMFGRPSGKYNLIYDNVKPTIKPLAIVENGDTLDFPEQTFRYVKPDFLRAISAVPMNRAGRYSTFFPDRGWKEGGTVVFEHPTEYGVYKAKWEFDDKYHSDINVEISLTVNQEGYYSLPTPTISTLVEDDLGWGIVPGFYQGNQLQESFPLSYVYAQGLPKYPVLCRESTITTMASIMSNKAGMTMAIIPEPGQDRNPYEKDEVTHVKSWNIALSHMNRELQLTPMAYRPVLGEKGSYLKKGETAKFRIRITLQDSDWYTVYKHAVYDIYHLDYSFKLKENKQSLTDRLMKLYDYVMDDKTALWNEEMYKGKKIIAQSYMSGVSGADKDAMKNSDIGAVWMLAKLTQDSLMKETRIPGIRNFKILQQVREGFFKGAVEGQYYLAKSKRFTEEWGSHFEPVAITYYTMADLGNILLFEPDNKEILELLKNGAERLLDWQRPEGNWVVAYDHTTHKPIYTDLTDLRPTFYGLIIAYKILGDKKYLVAAKKAADWLIDHSIQKGHFLGVCGDARFVNDFATIQIAGAMLELYELTSVQRYLDAAIKTGKMYTTSIYTHPIPSRDIKYLNGKKVEDWQLSQVGLNFEHGGSMGSAVNAGPILLTSHCAFFLKLYSLTKDEIFRDMARLGALGRDAFVNEETGVASYYWNRFDHGAGLFPHHAWWQIGWIYDYLLAEAELRSNGKISFPRGFMTPKVGTHRTAGFASGIVDGKKASLILRKDLVSVDNPNVDYITAESEDGSVLFVVLLNNQAKENNLNMIVMSSQLASDKEMKDYTKQVKLNAFGYKIIKIKL